MSRIIKRKYIQARKEFKRDLYEKVKNNNAFGMMIIKTYTASQHRRHIGKIWRLLYDHKEARQDYSNKLFGKHLTGEDEIMHSLYFADRELYQKYVRRIPERFAMGDALAVAYKAHRRASQETE